MAYLPNSAAWPYATRPADAPDTQPLGTGLGILGQPRIGPIAQPTQRSSDGPNAGQVLGLAKSLYGLADKGYGFLTGGPGLTSTAANAAVDALGLPSSSLAAAGGGGLAIDALSGSLGGAADYAAPAVSALLSLGSGLANIRPNKYGIGTGTQVGSLLAKTAANALAPAGFGMVLGPMIDYAFMGNDIVKYKQKQAKAGATQQRAIEDALYAQIAPDALASPSRGFQMTPGQVQDYLVDARMVEPSTVGAFGSPWTQATLADASRTIAQDLARYPSLLTPSAQTGEGGITPGTELSSLVTHSLSQIPGTYQYDLVHGTDTRLYGVGRVPAGVPTPNTQGAP